MPGAPTILFRGPVPPAGHMFCTVCAGSWKAVAMAVGKAEIDKIRASGEDAVIELTRYNRQPPDIAVCWGLFPAMMAPPQGNGMMPLPVPLCWSHQLSIQLQETALQLGSPAMLGGGPGGAFLLGQGG